MNLSKTWKKTFLHSMTRTLDAVPKFYGEYFHMQVATTTTKFMKFSPSKVFHYKLWTSCAVNCLPISCSLRMYSTKSAHAKNTAAIPTCHSHSRGHRHLLPWMLEMKTIVQIRRGIFTKMARSTSSM